MFLYALLIIDMEEFQVVSIYYYGRDHWMLFSAIRIERTIVKGHFFPFFYYFLLFYRLHITCDSILSFCFQWILGIIVKNVCTIRDRFSPKCSMFWRPLNYLLLCYYYRISNWNLENSTKWIENKIINVM